MNFVNELQNQTKEINSLFSISDNRTFVGFASYYTSDPYLAKGLYEGWDLTPYQRNTFHTNNMWGYNSWNNFDEKMKSKEIQK